MSMQWRILYRLSSTRSQYCLSSLFSGTQKTGLICRTRLKAKAGTRSKSVNSRELLSITGKSFTDSGSSSTAGKAEAEPSSTIGRGAPFLLLQYAVRVSFQPYPLKRPFVTASPAAPEVSAEPEELVATSRAPGSTT